MTVAATSAGLSLGFNLPVMAMANQKMGLTTDAVDINAWIRISPNNQVTCEVARAEMG